MSKQATCTKGTGIVPTAGANNVATNNPQLAPLTNNGGPTPTPTHATLPASPAIDAGDPAIVFNPAESDQRGAPFVRVVDGDDFIAWQRGLGATGAAAAHANGNADFDQDVDGDDLMVWTSMFGSAAAAIELQAADAADGPRRGELSAAMVDAAMAYDQMLADAAPRRSYRPRLPRAR